MEAKAGRHFEETHEYSNGLVKYVERNTGVEIETLVADYIK
jgi:hypothetical protein